MNLWVELVANEEMMVCRNHSDVRFWTVFVSCSLLVVVIYIDLPECKAPTRPSASACERV